MRGLRSIHPTWLILLLLALVASMALTPLPATAQEPPERPNPPGGRPNPPPDRPGPPALPSAGGGDSASQEIVWTPCSSIYGIVSNWGYHNEPKLPVQFSGASWQTQKITDDNGHYASDCMGNGIGLVNAIAPPGLMPLTTDVALRLGYKPSYELNLGLYSGQMPTLYAPAIAASPTVVAPGEPVSYTIRVAAPQAMWNVIITDLLPNELTPVAANATAGNVEIWGNLLTVDVGHLAAGHEVEVTLVATVGNTVPVGTTVSNQATLIYADNLAVQTPPVSIEVAVKSAADSPPYLPETGSETPN